MSNIRPLAVVTGASSGIGLELARLCARNGYDLIIAADKGPLEEVAAELHDDVQRSKPSRPISRPPPASRPWKLP